MFVTVLTNLAGGLAGATFAALFLRRISLTTASALWAISNFLLGLTFVLGGKPGWACWCAGVTALCAWQWWNNGGGDGTRRRLKSWARRFQGVRRTAPQGA